MDAKSTIQAGKAILGIEFGSTRIKAVLIDEENNPIAQGSHTWENQLVDGLWTYSIGAIWFGLQDCYANLRKNVLEKYDIEIEKLASIGISAMMHGYMPFNEKGEISFLPAHGETPTQARPQPNCRNCLSITFLSVGASPISTRQSSTMRST